MQTKGFNAGQFAEIMSALRGNMSQTDVAHITGVPVHTISRLEKGQIKQPSWEDLVQVAIGFGLTPNDMAAMTGLWISEEEENTQIDPQVTRVLHEIRQYLAEAPRTEQRLLGDLIDACLKSRQWRMQQIEKIPNSVIPAHIQEKLRPRK